ncbi:metallophosphoesterase [Thermoproteota archaeon]
MVSKEILEEINSIQDFPDFYNNFHNKFMNGEIDINNTNAFDVISTLKNQTSMVFPEKTISSPELPEVSKEQDKTTQDPIDNLYSSTNIVFSYEGIPKKREIQDFVSLFNYRYNALKNMLMKRQELESPTSISRVSLKTDREEVAIIGMIYSKYITKNGHVIMTIEDPTGTIKVLINKNKPEMLEIAKDCVPDEVIGVTGPARDNMLFANTLLIPDIPLTKELKKAPDEVYLAVTGDMHFGSNMFLHEEWDKFIKWIRAETGSEEQRSLARKIRYLVIVGDLVEGVGIYPGQEDDLEIKDIYEQYQVFAEHLKKIPSYINIIICPGNHDAMRIAEPQPPLYKDFASAIYELPNVQVVSNPAIVRIHEKEDFPGFDLLLYHGFSFIYYADQVESIRAAGGQSRVDMIMKFLLQRRHLAPTHKSTLYLPDADKDNLLIEQVPDMFIAGHIHRTGVFNYRNVQMIEESCWLSTTEYQEKMGLKPQPARVPLINLKTRKAKILKFITDEKDDT